VEKIDRVVIGAGVVGLAVAAALAREGLQTLVLEAEGSFGTGISSRNSEVIHAGIYYEPGTLKARLCTAGRDQLYEFCTRYGVPHSRCGKLIVATSAAQETNLQAIQRAAAANGVELTPLDRKAILDLEPEVAAVGGLLSPLTGIIDSHAYMFALIGLLESHGGTVVYGSRVSRMWLQQDGIAIAVNGEPPELLAAAVVNCAGLAATAVAASVEGLPQAGLPISYLAKGNYFTVDGRAPFRHLVYPIPEPGGLGIHLTLDLAGRARFGPDVEWIQALDYAVDQRRADKFYAAVRRYWPGLPDGSLRAAYAGVRPKICGPGQPAADFRIDAPPGPEVPLVNLFGIESPGLTASLAIAEHVVRLLQSAGLQAHRQTTSH
jgi:L-2-hydroxyglutarate oxidase LhgO